ncbi:MAG: thioredoxin family protein [Burkholderiaceae bacterium]|nr:thioredoxin family protein [Rhodoferax sp.]MCB2030994.1 thioredoxin family protein [Rhodoferax sp.]MCB2043645.1 thioredoxin family protein [Rhodoferax sp.]MCP5263124.1 thioredoxin family protein [Rhodoferax sp.]MCW5628268.1 thioredoxin family protein [Rhodoferax sp.]
MLRRTLLSSAALAGLGVSTTVLAAPAVGQKAPAFSLPDTAGKTVALSSFRGRHVVLEWVNPGCPYVRKHYGSANMQGTQKEVTAAGVVWLAINSTEEAASDYLAPEQLAAWMREQQAGATHTLMDVEGTVGKAYGARTTPHMYIIDPQGLLVYAGGIDSIASSRVADIKTAVNYVKQGVREALAGQPISSATTRPYGCSIKYKT